MSSMLFLLIVLISLKASNQQNGYGRINEGASTSRQNLNNCEHCELENGALRMISLMLAEDIRGDNLTNMINNRFDELQAFSDEIFSYVIEAQYSASQYSNKTRQNYRLDYYTTYLFEALLSIFQRACSEHYYHKLWYEYDSQRKIILVHEHVSRINDNNSVCLCENYQERNTLDEPLLLPSVTYPVVVCQLDLNRSEATLSENTVYHIIPLPLIVEFLEKWLTGPTDNTMNEYMGFNGCAKTLHGRLKRSLQKLVIAKLLPWNMETDDDYFRVQTSDDDDIYTELISNAESCFGGNIFLGPQFRGPLDPSFDEKNLRDAFEIDSAPIIGQERYNELLQLFHQLKYFTNRLYERPPFLRLMSGFKLFIKIANLLIGQSITPMMDEQWELREPTDEELRRHMESEELIMLLKLQKYWAIKKPLNRSERFVKDYPKIEDPEKTSFLKDTTYLWDEFIMNLMTISMQARARKKSLPWLCDFKRLYNDYLFNNPQTASNQKRDCPICLSFDEYLYLKISESKDWVRCNGGTKVSSDWCSAWRRIMKSETELKFNENNYSKNLIDNLVFMKDLETFMRWLTSKMLVNKCKKNKSALTSKPRQSNYLNKDLFNIKIIESYSRLWEKDGFKVFGYIIKSGDLF